jgi:SAM-dependent methyltransferase
VSNYSPEFYAGVISGMQQSAARVVPLVVERLQPKSVIDLGCGRGAWVKAFLERGVEKVVGVDGPWAPQAGLLVPEANFQCADLERDLPDLGRFDCGVSLEVAEHLSVQAGRRLVAYLTSRCDVVVFSAAIPGQGGTDHITERWQTYWVSIFAEHGYAPATWLRDAIWSDPQVEPWYSQNVLVFSNASDAAAQRPIGNLDVVHPRMYQMKLEENAKLRNLDPSVISARTLLRAAVPLLASKVVGKLSRRTS